MMRQSDRRAAGRSASCSSPVPQSPGAASLAGLCPTWSDAVTQLHVQAQLQNMVQPRLDSFAERLGGIVATAQSELRDLERLTEKSQMRLESRLTELEGRVAALADAASRTEQ